MIPLRSSSSTSALHRRIARGGVTVTHGSVRKSLAPFLNVRFYKLLSVALEHGVDLVEQIVELFLQFLALLRGRGDLGGLLDAFFRRRLLLALTLGHDSLLLSLQPLDQ